MREIDLVPLRYRRRRLFVRGLAVTVAAALVLCAGVVGARQVLLHRISTFDREIDRIEAERAQVEQERRELERVTTERDAMQQQFAVLEGLRGGIAAIRMFEIIDRALDRDIRFTHWDFRRAGEIVDRVQKPVETGYFIVLPQDSPDAPERAWQQQTHMEIRAVAETHAALAGFVRRLSRQREIESARILETRASSRDPGRVDFELAIVVRSLR